MKKSFIFGAALMLMGALSFQSCTKADNPSVPREPADAVFDQGMDLADAIAKFAKDGVLSLPEGIELTMNKEIKLTEPLMIVGNEKKPAFISATAGIVTNSTLTFSNVDIDATELKNENLVSLPTTDAKTNNIEEIAFDNVIIKGLGKALFYSAAKGNLIKNFTINNSIIEVAADITVIDFTKGSSAVNINIANSTLYAPTKTTKSMYSSQGGQKVTELGSDLTQTFNLQYSTFYNFAPTRNFFSHRQNSQKWLNYNVEGVITLDCGKVGQVIKGLNGGGQSPNPKYSVKNFFSLSTGDTGIVDNTASENTNGAGTEIVPEGYTKHVFTFADVTKGNFTQSTAASGDPRWIANAQ